MGFESVRPHTLSIMRLSIDGLPDVYKVFGGRNNDIWVATFLDKDEAQAWIDGSVHYGATIKGWVHDASGNDSRKVPEAESGTAGGSVREVQERDTGRPGPTLLLP